MSKLSQAFGKNYEKNKVSILSRSFEMGGHIFKVRVPNVGELEAIYTYEVSDDNQAAELAFVELTKNLTIDSDHVVKTDNDIIVDGRSMREAAKNKILLQHRITEYFKLLVPENGESLESLEYSDIDQEFPLSIQMQFIDRINEVISPDYKETRGK